MKNREYLLNMSLYDMLCKMNEGEGCVLHNFIDKSSYSRCVNLNITCDECIAAWLNEEYKGVSIYDRKKQ